MPSFAYSAINSDGFLLQGEIQATDLSGAREALRGNGLIAQTLEQLQGDSQSSGGGLFGRQKKVKPKSLQIFSRQFATMIEAGLKVVLSLVILEQQTDDQALGLIIDDVRERVEGGSLLSEAMAQHPNIFTRLYVAMVEAGEAAGALDIGARPRRHADREGAEDQAPREGRDDLPDRRAHLRDARPGRDADVPRPGLRQDLRSAGRRAADADAVRPVRLERACATTGSSSSRSPVACSSDSSAGRRPRAGARPGIASSCACRCRSATSSSKVAMARFSRTLSTLVAVGRRHHARRSRSRPDGRQLGRRVRDHRRAATRAAKAPRSRSR